MPERPGRPAVADIGTLEAETAEASPGDLRTVLLAAVCWIAVLEAFVLPFWCVLAEIGAATVWLLLRRRRRRPVVLLAACLVVAAAGACAATLRVQANTQGPVAALARQHASVTLTGTVAADPRLREGRYAPYVLTRLTVTTVTAHGRPVQTRAPVLVLADAGWQRIRLGSRVRAEGQLDTADGPDLAGVLSTHRPPTVLDTPGAVLGAADGVRGAIRAAVAPLQREERSLIPALVDGDDQGMPAGVVEDFRVSGLTHLSAVSGTNLTLVVGFLLVLARWVGVRARGLVVVGALGVVGFVLLARTEPSVVRAAAMGSVALVGMGSNGRQKGVRALGVAVLVLLLLDPWLARSVGFALSALATAGILFLAPPWRDALAGWLPRWLAEAVAVPFAAQLACTPLVAAISGQVSLVAVAANMLVAVVVGPATVLGLVGGLSMLVMPPFGLVCGRVAGWCAWWIVAVAHRCAALPTAAVSWSTGGWALAGLTVGCALLAVVVRPLLRRRWWCLAAVLLLGGGMLRPLPTPGWPPDGWVLVACDVGQGDGLVLNAGGGRAVVVDTGPERQAMARCLDRLGVHRVPVVVLTHFHADHVDGLPAVLADSTVGEVDVTALREPASGAEQVEEWTAAAGVPERVPAYGEVRRVGDLTYQVVAPEQGVLAASHGEEGTVANNASLVLLVRVRGITILMSGDVEPEAQQAIERAVPGLGADVLKVPHHGSRYQDPAFLSGLGARLAVVSVGADNDYGHPAPETLDLLREAGMVVRRTDRDGAVAVVVRHGDLSVRSSR